jgi:UDP-N-acetylmuramate: L-alanyl-gamma-D-glutamyl-meso-diaminopimelate ligase
MTAETIRKIYMVGIGGIAMGTLAAMLKKRGYEVCGSDQNLYPPMSTHLEAIAVPVFEGFRAENVERSAPDACIIGNVVRRENPEAQFVLASGLPYLSMPEAIERFFLPHHKSIVVAGTHGKSTMSSLLAWVLARGGLDPSAFIGAFLLDWQASFRLGNGRFMVIEGDEYDTAFFDKGPKFLHYAPHIGVLSSIEYDHADIFPDFGAVLAAFRAFVHLIPEDGFLVANADDPNCMALAAECRGKVLTYGWSEGAAWRIGSADYLEGAVRLRFRRPGGAGEEELLSPLSGRHNAGNAMAVAACATLAGMDIEEIGEAVLAFGGVRRRQEIVGKSNGILVMDDFAHHPTAVRETLFGLRRFHPGKRVIAAFEPRTNSSRRKVFHEAYAAAFDEADIVCIKQPPGLDAIPEAERLDARMLAGDILRRGKTCRFFESSGDLLEFLVGAAAPGDLVVCMSNGSFDGLPHRLAQAFATR